MPYLIVSNEQWTDNWHSLLYMYVIIMYVYIIIYRIIIGQTKNVDNDKLALNQKGLFVKNISCGFKSSFEAFSEKPWWLHVGLLIYLSALKSKGWGVWSTTKQTRCPEVGLEQRTQSIHQTTSVNGWYWTAYSHSTRCTDPDVNNSFHYESIYPPAFLSWQLCSKYII